MLQRLRCWVENLGFLFVLAIFAVVAIFSFCRASRPSALSYWPLALALSLHFQLLTFYFQGLSQLTLQAIESARIFYTQAKSQ